MDIRYCVKVLRRLEESGHLMIVDQAGPKGTNLYGLNAVCKGKFNPPTPSEIDFALKHGYSPREAKTKRTTPGKKTPPRQIATLSRMCQKRHPNR